MGVVFTTLFAAGVLLLEQSDTSSVHLDVEHALMGNLESLIWLSGRWAGGPLVDPDGAGRLPPELPRMALACSIMIVLTAVFWRWLKIATFDEGFAEALGIPAAAVGFGLVIAAALAAVAAFEAVGSIIVIAMFICPPAAARLMTSTSGSQVLWSVVFAAVSAVLGYVLRGTDPVAGAADSVSAAGMIATVSGLLLGSCLPFRAASPPGAGQPLRRLPRDAGRRPHPVRLPQFVNSVSTSCGLCLIAA
jgi:manganese/zinc/iron transport system permease protein